MVCISLSGMMYAYFDTMISIHFYELNICLLYLYPLPPSSHVKEPSVTVHYEHYTHDEWSIYRGPVALAKFSVPTHHISMFRVPWRLNYSRPEYS